jgi:dephospho-CoA kinase
MKVIGLTGGIGSGKTTVANMFKELGVPVYIADDEARRLSNNSSVIKKKLIELLGHAAYIDGELNRKFIANIIFNDPYLLKKVNAIIHPKVASHFKKWVGKQEGNYCIKEAAILFENGGYKDCFLTILVTAPKETRIRRVLNRDTISPEEIEKRMSNQWRDEEKSKLADLIVENTDLEKTQKQVEKIHEYFH